MDVVTVDGVKYEKASVVAKRFRYTSDYIGQLCRSRKIDAQLVGRSWYVNPLSVETHKGEVKKDKKTTPTTKSSEITNKIKEKEVKSRLDVEATINKNTAKMLRSQTSWGEDTQKKTSKISYKVDEADLFPVLSNQKPAVENESLKIPIQKLPDDQKSGFKNEVEPDSAPETSEGSDIVKKEQNIPLQAVSNENDSESQSEVSFVVTKTNPVLETVTVLSADKSKNFQKLMWVVLVLMEIIFLSTVIFLDVNIVATKESFHSSYGLSFAKVTKYFTPSY